MTEKQKTKGYTNLPEGERQKILHAAMMHESALTVFKRLNALVIMRKNKPDDKSRKVRQTLLDDRNWVRNFL